MDALGVAWAAGVDFLYLIDGVLIVIGSGDRVVPGEPIGEIAIGTLSTAERRKLFALLSAADDASRFRFLARGG